MPRVTIASVAADLLEEHGALAAEEIAGHVVERGATRARHPTQAVSRALNDDDRFRRLSDGRWATPERLLRGVALLHR
jgi:hypothetical protein